MTDVTDAFRARARSWQTIVLPLRCFRGADLRNVGAPFALRTEGTLSVTLKEVRLLQLPGEVVDCDHFGVASITK